jgi:hypothetical protein
VKRELMARLSLSRVLIVIGAFIAIVVVIRYLAGSLVAEFARMHGH